MGLTLSILAIITNIVYQGFAVGNSIWLAQWSSDENIVINGTTDTKKRDIYLGVYGALGIGRSKYNFWN